MAKFLNRVKEKKPSRLRPALNAFSQKFSFLKWIDPFTYVDIFVMPQVRKFSDSFVLEMVVNVVFAFIFAALVYLILGTVWGTSSPLVVVYSASMEPTLVRGDVVALSKASVSSSLGAEVFLNRNLSGVPVSDFAVPSYSGGGFKSLYFNDLNADVLPVAGDIVVYNTSPFPFPVIHRAIYKINALDGTFLITKGDNQLTNYTFDQDCGKVAGSLSEKGCVSFYPPKMSAVEGKSLVRIPFVGCVKLWLFDDLSSLLFTGKLPRDFAGFC